MNSYVNCEVAIMERILLMRPYDDKNIYLLCASLIHSFIARSYLGKIVEFNATIFHLFNGVERQ